MIIIVGVVVEKLDERARPLISTGCTGKVVHAITAIGHVHKSHGMEIYDVLHMYVQ